MLYGDPDLGGSQQVLLRETAYAVGAGLAHLHFDQNKVRTWAYFIAGALLVAKWTHCFQIYSKTLNYFTENDYFNHLINKEHYLLQVPNRPHQVSLAALGHRQHNG